MTFSFMQQSHRIPLASVAISSEWGFEEILDGKYHDEVRNCVHNRHVFMCA